MTSNASGSAISIIGTVILVFFLLSIAWELLHGLRRGLYRQAIHTGFMLLSLLAAYLLTKSVWNELFSRYPDMTALLEDIAKVYPSIPDHIYSLVSGFDISIATAILALPLGIIILPILFVVFFIIINIIGKFLSLILRCILGIKRGTGIVKRLSGLAIGAIEGALVASVILLPVVSIAGIIKDTAPSLSADGDVEEAVAEIVEVSDGPVLNFVGGIGGNAILDSFSTVKLDGVEVNLHDEAVLLAKVILENYDTLSSVDFKNPTEEEKAVINSVTSELTDSYYISNTLSAIISGFANAVHSGDIPLELEAPFDTLLGEAVEIFRTVDSENLGTDLQTLLKVYFLIDDAELFKAIDEGGDPVEALVTEDENGKTAISRIIGAIEENARMKGLVTAMTKLSLAILGDHIGAGADITEIYDTVKDEINGGILETKREDFATEEEYKAALTEKVDGALTNSGVELEPELVEKIADYLDDEFIKNGVTTLDDEHFNDVILSYYDYYLEHKDESGVTS